MRSISIAVTFAAPRCTFNAGGFSGRRARPRGMDPHGPRITYAGYLRLNELLGLQAGPDGHLPAPCANEQHFIVVHQIYELWFKQVLTELDATVQLLGQPSVPEGDIPRMVRHLERVSEIFRLLSAQWKVMETLAPQEFLAFRDRLGTSSGFESWQMRALELTLGLSDEQRVEGVDPIGHLRRLHGVGDMSDAALADLEARVDRPSLHDVLLTWLGRTPIDGSLADADGDEAVVAAFVDGHLSAMRTHADEVIARMVAVGQGEPEALERRMSAGVDGAASFLRPGGVVDRAHAGLLYIESHRHLPLLAWPRRLIDTVVEVEQSMLAFRHAHARMVERMIGRRMGTGGSAGVDYLDATTKYRIFTELWAVRTMLVKETMLPQPRDAAFYGFAGSE
jgi:tryptophan 2,3-dioxygenase